jgi:hypothetical protein
MTIRLAFGLILLAATLAACTPAAKAWLRQPRAVTWLLWLFVASRLAGWFGIYVLLGDFAQYSDLAIYYYPEAKQVVAGGIPYVDVHSSYGPLFGYFTGLLLPLWNSRAAAALPIVACEIAAVLWFARLARSRSGENGDLLAATLLVYCLNPAALYWSGMLAYNSALVLLVWVVATGLLLNSRYASSIVVLAAGLLWSKILVALVAPIWLLHPRRKIGVLAIAVLAGLGLVVIAQAQGVDLLMPVKREGQRSSSGNLWFLLSGLDLFSATSIVWRLGPLALMGSAVGGLCAALLRSWRKPPTLLQLCGAIGAIGWLFMILSKKTFPHYTPMFVLFSLYALLAREDLRLRHAGLLAAIGAIGIVEPGLWNALGQPPFLASPWASGRTAGALAVTVADVLLVAISSYLAVSCAAVALRTEMSPAPVRT